MGSAAVGRYLGSISSLPDFSIAALTPTLGFILPTTAQPSFGLGGISPTGALGAAALFVGSGAALSEATIATAAARAFLLAPVAAPVAVGSVALAALIAYALYQLTNPQATQTPSTQAPPAPGAGTTYGVKTKRYRLELTGTTQGTSYEYTDYAGAYAVAWTGSVSQFGRTDWTGNCQTQVNAAPLSPGGGSLAKSTPGEGTGPPGFRVLEMGTGIPATANEVSGVTVVTTPAQASSNTTKTGIPGYPLAKGVGDPVAGRNPAVTQVPNSVPNRAPQTRLTDPKTGRTVDTVPGTGVVIAKDPLTGTTIATTPDILLPLPDLIGGIGQGTGTGTTVCPDPCPDLDLTPVLEAVAELSTDVASLSTRVGYDLPEIYRHCGTDLTVSSVQQAITCLDLKLGLDEALALVTEPPTAQPVCTVGAALESLTSLAPSITVIQGFEVGAIRDTLIHIVFNADGKLQQHASMSIPMPVPLLTREQILAAVAPLERGDWLCQLQLESGRHLQGWFTGIEAGRTYLFNVSALCASPPKTDGYSATYRQNKGPTANQGAALSPVKAFFYGAGTVASQQEWIDLR